MPRGKRAESNGLDAAKALAAKQEAEAAGTETQEQETETEAEETPGVGHNVREFTGDERFALLSQHKTVIVRLREAKKAAAKAAKDAEKLCKAELGDEAVLEIDTIIELETVEGEARFKAEVERQVRMARLMGLPVGMSGDLFDSVDRTPAVDRAAANGKRAGLAGETMQCPHDPSTPQYHAYVAAWTEGQRILFNIKPIEPVVADTSAEFDTLQPSEQIPEPHEGASA